MVGGNIYVLVILLTLSEYLNSRYIFYKSSSIVRNTISLASSQREVIARLPIHFVILLAIGLLT
jgi:hypothetical protein